MSGDNERKFKPGDRVRVTAPEFTGVLTRVTGYSKANSYIVEPVLGPFPGILFRQFHEVFLERDVLGELAGI